jgi:lysophospholipase L1-like esterase
MAGRRRVSSWIQREFPFIARSRQLDRLFKRLIAGFTLLVVLGSIVGTSVGRNAASRLGFESRKLFNQVMGFPEDRRAFEAQRDRDRARGIVQTCRALEQVAIDGGPKMREFLKAARFDADSAVIRWGNFDYTLALSSAVFEPDDAGRSYRLLPNTRSIWLLDLTMYNVSALFEIPDTPEARRLGEAIGGRVVPESLQTTNSWGCRGPEPDPTAPVRGIVLGDSNMQGLLVGDDQTPPARLEARLEADLDLDVSVLNTGVLGYSPEQYYYSLIAFYEKFKPDFVIISICNNDFGDMNRPENWAEGEYWLELITQFCRSRGVVYVGLPVPQEDPMTGRRNETIFPGQVSKIFHGSGINYLSPLEEFTTEHLTLKAESIRSNRPFAHSPLFNRRYSGDNHLSPLGSDLWAKLVARRLRLIWETGSIRPAWLKRSHP